ncbi:MAG: pantoate--beta-alanine ligase [Clostridiales bacterium]|nr:pantoate--beta-alanine ligase [Clostridiales bacterium]MCF8023535.1 pantoate--beta-alanine ligase [Clostridiales bacterium]
MQICESIKAIKASVSDARARELKIGLVPTMGCFHEGHLSLMRKAVQECDYVVVSLFINPTQFGPEEDFNVYPKSFERDAALAEDIGVNALFFPPVEEMYPPGYQTYVEVENITGILCGRSRPGHFRGVTTVVAKLFNIVQPDRAYFGQKDAQQVAVIKQMVKDLNMDIKIITGKIIRENGGLAMSSRNTYLNPAERNAATVLYRSLKGAEESIAGGERDPAKLREQLLIKINSEPLADVDYVEILSMPELQTIAHLQGKILIAVAVWFGKARLIDNIIMEV